MRDKRLNTLRLRLPLIVSGTILSSLLLLSSQQGFSDDRQEIIDRGVEIKIEEYIKRQETRCMERALTEAVALVDSMVRAGAVEMRIDPVIKPPRPGKPDKPVLKTLPDSLGHSKVLKD